MSVAVVEEQTKMQSSTTMTVVLAGKDREELTSLDTRNNVITIARERGFPARGLSNVPEPYPVDKAGKTDDELVLGKRPFVGYRVDYVVSSGIP